jgi:hypothetical protein
MKAGFLALTRLYEIQTAYEGQRMHNLGPLIGSGRRKIIII